MKCCAFPTSMKYLGISYKRKFLFGSLLLLIACGTDNNARQGIAYNPDNKNFVSAPEDLFSFLGVIPLQGPDDVIIDSGSDLIYDEGRFYVVDASRRKRVDIFDTDGRYTGSVASAGRAGNEYIGIDNVQVTDGTIAVYSYHNKAIYHFNVDGSFIEKEQLEYNPLSLLKDQDGYWGFSGYTAELPERVVKMDAAGKIVGKYLPSEMPIIALEERAPVFTGYNRGVLVREAFRNEIFYVGDDGQEEVFLKFDFGKYNVPKEYFKNSDPYTAAEKLMESDFVMMNRFLINENHKVLSVDFQLGSREGKIISSLGVESNGKWRWLKSEKEGTLSMFFSSTRQMTSDSDVVLLVDGERVREFAAGYPELVGEFDDTTDNPCIVLCRLK
jgi:hypothetical protein